VINITIIVTIIILTLYIVRALREIRKHQKSVDLLIPKAPFVRLVREIMHGITIGQHYHIQASALEALQEAAEAALVNEFECKYMIIWLICLLY